MRNELFRHAKKSVASALHGGSNQREAIQKAKNELSSAFANSTLAEQAQLQEMQKALDSLEKQHSK